jgi:hypothetical protein
MEDSRIIERYGGVTKEEPLTTLDSKLVMANTQVMESKTPFSGYYNDGPQTETNAYLYFVLDGHHPFETILRATHNVLKKVNYPFDATPGSTSMNNRTCQVIRVKQVKRYCQISHLQELFQNEGVKFKKHFSNIKEEMVLIRLQKFFYLDPLGEDMYLDQAQPNVGYFVSPNYIKWNDFKAMTVKAKYETDLLFFDAATAFFYENKKIVNLVRIYKEDINAEKLRLIKNRYIKLITE